MKRNLLIFASILALSLNAMAIDHPGIVSQDIKPENFTLIEAGIPSAIVFNPKDYKGISIAVDNLLEDFDRVTGNKPVIRPQLSTQSEIVIGSIDNPVIASLADRGVIDIAQLKDKNEKYIITTVDDGAAKLLIVAGSDRRGTIYGVYELSEQIGVSPWYWWADVPSPHTENLSMMSGTYTAGEPAVTYRGLFLNDEAPCLTSWVKNTYGTNYGDHEFYAKVCELILRLRGNYLWPAMWGWAFYADDPANSATADEMGVVIGTSHHEPMARNHQEYARNREKYGQWNYATNSERLDGFFAEGIRRIQGTEDIVTIGMRGDGDEAMSEEADVALLERVINRQREIIESETGRPAYETPQLWALYKEVLDYYDKGLKAPDDVILMFCDDNWGNVRRLPNEEERRHPGGWGMYYHVDYVGAPRNTKWLNVTPIQNMWEQLSLTHEYGVDKLWILNVGDLKPMEYPITLFMDMAWDPTRYSAETLKEHPRKFCAQQFGEQQADEAARILNLYSKYNGRVTAEMLDAQTYNLKSGEWKTVRDDYLVLETEALRQFMTLAPEYRDAYRQLILFPVQAMANLYDLYYSVAMNQELYGAGDARCDDWAKRAKMAFDRDAELCRQYNEEISSGKWRGMMTQKHIGYRTWNDDFPADTMPEVYTLGHDGVGGYEVYGENGAAVIEAEHFYDYTDAKDASWTLIPDMGRTLSGMTLMPRLADTDGAKLRYRLMLPDSVSRAKVHVVVKSTLAFSRKEGHRFRVGFEDAEPKVVNFNADLNEKPENIYTKFYPTVARRVAESVVDLDIPTADGPKYLVVSPLDPGVVIEKIVVDYGGYDPSYLFGTESKVRRTAQH